MTRKNRAPVKVRPKTRYMVLLKVSRSLKIERFRLKNIQESRVTAEKVSRCPTLPRGRHTRKLKSTAITVLTTVI